MPAALLVPVALGGLVVATTGTATGQAADDRVEQVYQRDCATCHGARGEGSRLGPVLRGVGRASTHYWVSTGRMPLRDVDDESQRRPPPYSPAMIDALVDHVASFGPGGPEIPDVDPARGDLAEGGELYRLNCAACHSWGGTGGALLFREAPATHAATPEQIAEAVRLGPGTMPAFGASSIDDDQLDGLVAYVRYLDDPDDRGGQPLWHLGPLAEGGIAIVLALGLLLLVIRWIGTRE